jgi:hypothetical protein
LSERWIRRLLFLIGVWNIVGGVSALVDPSGHFEQAYRGSLPLVDPVQIFFFRATWINVIAWGFGYILAGSFPSARVPILAAGGLGKLAYFGACLALFLGGHARTALLAAGILDVVLAAFFAYVLFSKRG